jgi:hypothetical protein
LVGAIAASTTPTLRPDITGFAGIFTAITAGPAQNGVKLQLGHGIRGDPEQLRWAYETPSPIPLGPDTAFKPALIPQKNPIRLCLFELSEPTFRRVLAEHDTNIRSTHGGQNR